jgi:D-glycerate 3-kinase
MGYLETALQWFTPVAYDLATLQRQANRPILVALNGCQGSGKTTASDYLCTSLSDEQGVHAVTLSLDDFYLTHRERQSLAASVHPLLATRGAPGTHDMSLLRLTLAQLLDTRSSKPIAIPRFDKATDDRCPLSDWNRVETPVQCILLEGWCLGARPESADTLAEPVNDLERGEDPLALWRTYCNTFLTRHFLPLYPLFDQWIMLQAPSFDCVFNWRREQEHKLAASLPTEKAGSAMNDDSLQHFIQHYERITHNCLDDLPHTVNHLFNLDERRGIKAYNYQSQVTISP